MAQGWKNIDSFKNILTKRMGPFGMASLVPVLSSMNKWSWENNNINTMDKARREKMLEAFEQSKKDWESLFKNNKQQNINEPKVPEYDLININESYSSNHINNSNQEKELPVLKPNNIIPKRVEVKEEQEVQQPKFEIIDDYISKLQNINQPYIDALQSYVNNYNKNLIDSQRAQRYFTGLAGWTGNQSWANLANQYNTLNNEANRINAIKQLQSAQAGDINAINEVMGNMAIAKELDLPYEAAFANKNLLTALTANRRNLTDWEKAQLSAELKRYGIDVGYNKAMAQQALRNKGALDVALTNAAAFGGGVAPGLNMAGGIATPQELTMAQVLNKAQQQNR